MKKDDVVLKINKLKKLLNKVKELNQDDERVKNKITLINTQIIDYELQLLNISQHITFKNILINNILKSKVVMLNIFLLTLEVLNTFTDVFSESDSELLRMLSILIPALTIFLRAFQMK